MKLEFEKFPVQYLAVELFFKQKDGSGYFNPSDAISWIREIEAAQEINDRASVSVARKHFPNFEAPDAKIAAAFEENLGELKF